ncbi:3-oxoacyl-ACP reductase [Ornithinimicrobium sp. CNJ-824]|uniref:3-oxoacyl-ACP reductase n=1 Tax=Ornithinimicrobium sp. CNJ-824 TaxID=1904966 RepID=UPI00095E84D7|nr:3-oxoacyl-ACP reductase [Ornithinimicrobium sp. CNJ-824]OLT23595.1 3-oxoacyl-ACP reductase [Ornithinimicrobium sp. CNJ-824]
MADLVQLLTSNPLARQLGVPQPTRLRRGRDLPTGPVVVGAAGGAPTLVRRTLDVLGVAADDALVDTPQTRVTETTDEGRTRQVPAPYPGAVGAVLVDATAATAIEDLEALRGVLRPALRALEASGRVVVVGVEPETAGGPVAVAVQQALEGVVRSVGKELRKGATANLVRVDLLTDAPTTATDLASTLSFLLEGRSAYVSGQVLHVGHADEARVREITSQRPFEGQVVVVTGAGRGIGASIAETFARDGAMVVAVDVPAGGEGLSQVANRIGGTALQLDITAAGAGQRIAGHVAQRFGDAARIHTIVHNAGITRDRLLVNTDEERWGSVLEVNLAAQVRINEVLLDPDLPGGLDDGGRIVGVASTSGIAGNRGQANYAASKAGVIGLVRAMGADERLGARGITVNAVAPGFIETEMTAKIPVATREIGRRINSLQQGGRPVDVAETIAWFAQPASAAVTGRVLRVCGQSQLGA